MLERVVEICPGQSSIAGVAASERWIAISYTTNFDDRGAYLYDAKTGLRHELVVAGDTSELAFSPDGRTLAVATAAYSGPSRVVWVDLDQSRKRRSVDVSVHATFIEWSADSKRLYVDDDANWLAIDATTGGDDREATEWFDRRLRMLHREP